MKTCARCGRTLAGAEVALVPPRVVWLTSLAFAFFHGGMWANDWSERLFCRSCRAKVVPMALAASGVVLTGAAAGIFLLVRLIRR